MNRLVALVILTLLWPALQLGVFWLRFNRMPPEITGQAWVFLPMGLVAALGVLACWTRATSQRQRRGVAIGYAVASPVAFLGSLTGGLVLPGIFGPLVYGALPLLAGSVAGFVVARSRADRPAV